MQMESERVRLRIFQKQEKLLDKLLEKEDEEALSMGQIVFSHF